MMQTFLPYPDFYESARCLDSKRLGKQRVEAWQIYLALTNPYYGWQNHPAVKMWRGYEPCLLSYGYFICRAWMDKRYKDTLCARFETALDCAWDCPRLTADIPFWLGNEKFHSAHRAILLGKNYEWYRQFGWSEKPAEKINGKWPYVWPVNKRRCK